MLKNSPIDTNTPENITTVLGFDYGTKRIGVAVGQTVTRTATSLIILKANHGTPQWREITHILNEWHPDALVVGIPLHMDSSSQPLTRAATTFGQQLHKRYQLPVYGADERLTTKESQSLIQDAPTKTGPRYVDAIAARIILQSWLNNRPVSHVDQLIS